MWGWLSGQKVLFNASVMEEVLPLVLKHAVRDGLPSEENPPWTLPFWGIIGQSLNSCFWAR